MNTACKEIFLVTMVPTPDVTVKTIYIIRLGINSPVNGNGRKCRRDNKRGAGHPGSL